MNEQKSEIKPNRSRSGEAPRRGGLSIPAIALVGFWASLTGAAVYEGAQALSDSRQEAHANAEEREQNHKALNEIVRSRGAKVEQGTKIQIPVIAFDGELGNFVKKETTDPNESWNKLLTFDDKQSYFWAKLKGMDLTKQNDSAKFSVLMHPKHPTVILERGTQREGVTYRVSEYVSQEVFDNQEVHVATTDDLGSDTLVELVRLQATDGSVAHGLAIHSKTTVVQNQPVLFVATTNKS